MKFGVRKLESWGYQMVQVLQSYLQPFLYDTPVWQTDIQTDGQTDGR